MVVNQKPSGMAKSMPKGLGLGLGVSMGITVAACTLLSWMILSGKAEWDVMGYGVIGVLLAASYTGATVSCRAIKHRKLLVCILSGVLYLCALAGITALLFGGRLDGVWISAMLIAGGTGLAALVHCAEKQEKGRRRKKRRL